MAHSGLFSDRGRFGLLAALFTGTSCLGWAGFKPIEFAELLPAVGTAPLLDRLFTAPEMAQLCEKVTSAPLSFSYRTTRALGTAYSQLPPRSKLAAARYALDQALGDDNNGKAIVLARELGLSMDSAIRFFEVPSNSFYEPAKYAVIIQKEQESKALRLSHYAEGLAALKRGQSAAGAESLLRAVAVDVFVSSSPAASPRDGDLFYALGLAYLNQGDSSHAGAAFRDGLDKDPSHEACRAGLARVSPQAAAEVDQARAKKAATERQALDSKALPAMRSAYRSEIKRHKSSRRKIVLFGAAGAAILLAGIVDMAVLDKPAPADSAERVYELNRRRTGAGALMGLGGGVMLLSGGGVLYYQSMIWGTTTPENFIATDRGFAKPAGPSARSGLRLELARLSF